MVVTMPCPVSWSEYEYNLYPDPHYLPTYSTVASANVKGSLSTLGYNYANVNSYVAINLGHN
jgi:predicted transcriptional regulator with HTH domain